MVRLDDSLRGLDRRLRQLPPDSLGFWLLCLAPVLFVAIVLSINEWPALRAAIAGADGVATIVGRDCGRDEFEYEFEQAGGNAVRGRSSASRVGVPCANLMLGATVTVRYTQDGRLGHVIGPDPMKYARTRSLMIAVFSLAAFGGTALVFIAFREQPRRPS
jgi:hypothetical protein